MFSLRHSLPVASAILVLSFSGLSTPATAQRGAITQSRNLIQLTERAAVVIRGTVAMARVEKHPELTNLHTVVVTIRVHETLKGQPVKFLTFRQFIWDIRDRYDAAGYKKGQDLLLLMNKPNAHGLSSPVGLDQGRFRILRNASGEELAVNGHGNVGLFRGVETRGKGLSASAVRVAERHKSGPVRLREFSEIVRASARQAR